MSLRMIWTAHAASNGVNGRNKRRITADRGRREVLVYLRRIESSVNNEDAASSSRSSSTCPMLRELIDSDGSACVSSRMRRSSQPRHPELPSAFHFSRDVLEKPKQFARRGINLVSCSSYFRFLSSSGKRSLKSILTVFGGSGLNCRRSAASQRRNVRRAG